MASWGKVSSSIALLAASKLCVIVGPPCKASGPSSASIGAAELHLVAVDAIIESAGARALVADQIASVRQEVAHDVGRRAVGAGDDRVADPGSERRAEVPDASLTVSVTVQLKIDEALPELLVSPQASLSLMVELRMVGRTYQPRRRRRRIRHCR